MKVIEKTARDSLREIVMMVGPYQERIEEGVVLVLCQWPLRCGGGLKSLLMVLAPVSWPHGGHNIQATTLHPPTLVLVHTRSSLRLTSE